MKREYLKHFERKEEASYNKIRNSRMDRHILGREKIKHKGPEAGINLPGGNELRIG